MLNSAAFHDESPAMACLLTGSKRFMCCGLHPLGAAAACMSCLFEHKVDQLVTVGDDGFP